MSTTAITAETPFARRLLAWAGERFPLANGVMALFVYVAALLSGEALVTGGELSISLVDVVSFFGVWAFFLMLRVFDEHKDYERDCEAHPDRVLQRGLITLDQLKAVGAVAIALQLGVSLLQDGGIGRVTMWWAIVLVWSLLMLKEFFIGEWLEPRLVPYAVSHLISLPLATLWMAQMGAGDTGLPGDVIWLALMAFALGGAFEVGRKLKAPEDERPIVDSYTKALGIRGAAIALDVLVVACSAFAAALLAAADAAGPIGLVVLALAALVGILAIEAFARDPTRAAVARAELVVSVAALVQLAAVSATLLAERGI